MMPTEWHFLMVAVGAKAHLQVEALRHQRLSVLATVAFGIPKITTYSLRVVTLLSEGLQHLPLPHMERQRRAATLRMAEV